MKTKILIGLVLALILAFLAFIFLSGPCRYSPGLSLDFTKSCDCQGLLIDTSFSSLGTLDTSQTWHCFGIMSNQKCHYLKPVGSSFEEIEYPCSTKIESSDIQKQREAILTNDTNICEQIQNVQVKKDCIETLQAKK